MYKFKVIDREFNRDELAELVSLINNDLVVLRGSDFVDDLDEVLVGLDDELSRQAELNLETIEELESEIKELKRKLESVVSGLI